MTAASDEEVDFNFDLSEAALDALLSTETPAALDQTDQTGVEIIETGPQSGPNQSILEALDIGDYPQHIAGVPGVAVEFLESFLAAVRDEYTTKGCAVYQCIWYFNFPANEEDVRRYSNAVRAAMSRVRRSAGNQDSSIVALLRFEILPDRRYVAVNYARMTRTIHSNLRAAGFQKRVKAVKERNSRIQGLL